MATGVVTILFTDLVRSTELLGRLGDERADDLRRAHFAILRAALEVHGGHEVKNIGDSLMAAFSSPASALACAIEMQQRNHAQARGNIAPMQIRIGINAGEATEEDGDYFGTPVVIARRLCDAARGGQIVASDLTRALVGSRGRMTFTPLGALSLKGIEVAVPACEVAWEPLDEGAAALPAVMAGGRTAVIGREPEREVLERAFGDARKGLRSLALIAGEAGIGKTTLAFDFARAAHADGALVLYGRCEEDLTFPYQPFAEALRHLVSIREADSSPFDGVPSGPSDPDTDRFRLFESVCASLAGAASNVPVVLVIDDLHWADKPTLLLLRHVVRTADPPFFVVGTYRDVELDRTHPFAEMLPDLRRDPGYERILLRGLSPDGVVAYLERRAGHTLEASGRALALALHDETGGNPFFLREIIRHLVESGVVYQRDGRWTSDRSLDEAGLPESVRDVIGRRLSRLGEECGDILAVASVIGREFDLSVLSRVIEISEDRLADVLDAAVGARGVIDEVPRVIGRYSFSHALVRETLYEQLSTNRRVRLHRRVGEAVEELYEGDLESHLAELAHHFYEAAVSGAEHAAIEYSRRAAARAVAQLAFEEAAQHIERALHTLDSLDAPDPEILCETLIAGAEVHQRMASLNQARVYGARAADIATGHGWPERLARAALGHGGLWIDIGIPNDELIGLLRRAINLLPEDHPMVPLLHGRLAMDLFSGEPAELELHSARAVELARRASDPRTLAYALVARRHAVSGPSALEERLAITAEAIARARDARDPSLELRARTFWFIELVESADLDGAEAESAEFFRLVEEYRQPFYLQYMARFLRVGHAIREGRFAEAMEILPSLTELVRQQGRLTSIRATAVQRSQLGVWYAETEPDETAINILVEFAATTPVAPVLTGWVKWSLGRVEEARRDWEQVHADSVRSAPDNWQLLGMLSETTDLIEAFGDREGIASVVYERAVAFAGRIVPLAATALVTVAETVDDTLGKCCEAMGRLDDAVRHYESAVSICERWRMRPLQVLTLTRLARALMSRAGSGDKERAREVLDAAIAQGEAIRMSPMLVDRARALRVGL